MTKHQDAVRDGLKGVLLAAGILSGVCHAQGAEPEAVAQAATPGVGRPAKLDGVEVHGKRISERGGDIAADLSEYGNQVQVIDAAEIEAGGYVNIAEAVQFLVRGANVGYSPDEGEYTLRLDGGGDRDTLVLLNGIPLYDRGPAAQEIWGSTIIDIHMVERVEVYRGGQSLYFGSNGGVGVINLITKQPDGTNKGELGVSYGQFDTQEMWGNVSMPVGDSGRHSVMLYGSSYTTDGARIFDSSNYVDNLARAGGDRDNNPLNRNNVGFKYLWSIDESSELRVNAQYAQIDFRDEFPFFIHYAATTTQFPMIDASFRKAWSDSVQTEAEIYYTHPRLSDVKMAPVVCRIPAGCPAANNPSATIPYGQWTGASEPSAVFYGLDPPWGGFEELTASVRNRVRFGSALEMTGGLQSVNYRNDSDPVFGVDDDVAHINGIYLDLRPTLPFSPSTAMSLAGRIDFSSSFDSKTIWKFGLRQPLGSGVYFRANGGTSYSLPRANEMYVNSPATVGNPNLQPEETESYNAGIGFDRDLGAGRFNAEIGAIYTDITDRIRGTTALQPNTYYNDTAINEIRGFTADVEYRGEQWRGSLSYTKIDAAPAGSNLQIDETPEYSLIGSLSYRSIDNRYHVDLTGRQQGPEWAAGGGMRVNFGDYFVMNATLGYWAGADQQHRFQFRIVNLLDEKYAERAGIGDQRYGEAFITGQITNRDPEYFYPYYFNGKPRSVFVSYSYRY